MAQFVLGVQAEQNDLDQLEQIAFGRSRIRRTIEAFANVLDIPHTASLAGRADIGRGKAGEKRRNGG